MAACSTWFGDMHSNTLWMEDAYAIFPTLASTMCHVPMANGTL